MSPEQAQGAPLDARSDLYSLGVLMFQMLTGRAPFIDDDAVVVMAKHIKDAPPELSDAAPGVEVPLPVEAVVRRALEKLPEKRPGSAEQMLSELEQALAASRSVESGVRAAVEAEDLPESLRLAERRMWVLGGLLVASLLAVVTLGMAMWSRPRGLGSAASQPVPGAPVAGVTDATTATLAAAATPTLAPSSAAENSAAIAPHPSAPDASAQPTSNVANEPATAAASSARGPHGAPAVTSLKKTAPRPAKTAPLEKRGNERYGRFD
jgi:serine/threonine-protein kinase